MDWKIICVIISFLVFCIYNFAVIVKFDIPTSLSETYYLFKNEKEWKKILFPLMMFFIAVFLMPAWLELSNGSNLEFMAFLSVGGIMFTGIAPSFRDSRLESNVHTYSACISAIFALLWIVFVTNLWYIIIGCFIVFVLIALVTKTIKRSMTYWLEAVACMSTHIAIIVYYNNL